MAMRLDTKQQPGNHLPQVLTSGGFALKRPLLIFRDVVLGQVTLENPSMKGC